MPFFERQLSRFSVPEEILGPASLRALREGGSGDERASVGYLPSATVGFIDHIFNASSGLLNSLLTLLNERTLGARMRLLSSYRHPRVGRFLVLDQHARVTKASYGQT